MKSRWICLFIDNYLIPKKVNIRNVCKCKCNILLDKCIDKASDCYGGMYTVQYTNTDATQIPHSNIPSPFERYWFQNEQDAALGWDLQPYHPRHTKTHLKTKSKYIVIIVDFERHCKKN